MAAQLVSESVAKNSCLDESWTGPRLLRKSSYLILLCGVARNSLQKRPICCDKTFIVLDGADGGAKVSLEDASKSESYS
jgi:hypothetical protein